jgi:hypothetical protein
MTKAIPYGGGGPGEFVALASSPGHAALFVSVINVTECNLVTPTNLPASVNRVKALKGFMFTQEERIMEGFFGQVFGFKSIHAQVYKGSHSFQTKIDFKSGEVKCELIFFHSCL